MQPNNVTCVPGIFSASGKRAQAHAHPVRTAKLRHFPTHLLCLPLPGVDDLLAARELELGAAKGLSGDSGMVLLGTDGQQHLRRKVRSG